MNFDEIRPYNDEEVQGKIRKLVEEPQFQQVMEQINPAVPYALFKRKMLQISTVREFQGEIVLPILEQLLKKSAKGVEHIGTENLQKGSNYLFVSTHRDIVLDSALMNYVLYNEGFNTAEIAIGDNLMKVPWVVDLVKLNKTFIVKRDLRKEEKVESSIQLSKYIHHTIREKGESIWIAQKSGRSKDGNDSTNPSILKMFNLGGPDQSVKDNIKALNICPVSIAYEYNPCDVLTMPELMLQAQGKKYTKEPMEDMIHMGRGIEGEKGRIVVSFGRPINPSLQELNEISNRNEWLAGVADLIDQEIHRSYHLMASNYIASDLLNNSNTYREHYTGEEKTAFENYMQNRLDQLDGDKDFKEQTFLKMYAYPVSNQEKARSN
jgi:glycerol-3-phosphate O-acyltransferase